jgi:excisionase family DNA binding protein
MKIVDLVNVEPVAVTLVEDMDQWVSAAQAAKIVGVSDSRIRQFVADGTLKSYQPTDSDHYFKRADVDALAKKDRPITGRPKGSTKAKQKE